LSREFIQYKKGCSNISTQYENVKNGKETRKLASGHNLSGAWLKK
jgi:hypothetical protein